ncbi:unnamed protein product [Cuscuta campestris]|uniref:Peptidase C1A papain C-terminal domain-containing protein n=1 Tax=Cuscuta campestris TaxID=132261 RepID=A0A484K5B3_9ASTE|nr:unnamed protein product [Cuscuta campestris]
MASHQSDIEENLEKSVYNFPGSTFTDQVNWVASGIVPPEIGYQGECSACWVWSSVKGFDAVSEISNPDEIPPKYSVQEVLNNVFPGEKGCRGGPTPCALEHLKWHDKLPIPDDGGADDMFGRKVKREGDHVVEEYEYK